MNTAPPMPAPDEKRHPFAGMTSAPETIPDVKHEREIGGPGGPEPTRYGDWERKGRCIDF